MHDNDIVPLPPRSNIRQINGLLHTYNNGVNSRFYANAFRKSARLLGIAILASSLPSNSSET